MSALGKQTWYRILLGHCESTIEIYSPDCEDIPSDGRCVYAYIHAEETLDEKTSRRFSYWCFWKIKTRENGQTNKRTKMVPSKNKISTLWLLSSWCDTVPTSHIKKIHCFGFFALAFWKSVPPLLNVKSPLLQSLSSHQWRKRDSCRGMPSKRFKVWVDGQSAYKWILPHLFNIS